MLRVTILYKLFCASVLTIRYMDDSKLTKFNRSCYSDCFECSIGSNGEKPGKMAFDFSLLQPISRRDKNRAQAISYLMDIVLATLENFHDFVSSWLPRTVTARYTYTMGKNRCLWGLCCCKRTWIAVNRRPDGQLSVIGNTGVCNKEILTVTLPTQT